MLDLPELAPAKAVEIATDPALLARWLWENGDDYNSDWEGRPPEWDEVLTEPIYVWHREKYENTATLVAHLVATIGAID